MYILVSTALILLHEAGGGEVAINPSHIAVLHNTTESAGGQRNKIVVKGVNCVLALSNGKIVSVVETCDTVRHAMEKAK
jgi:hypothetical protein